MPGTWKIVADGYFKSPGNPAAEGRIRLELKTKASAGFSLMISEDREFGWDKMKDQADMTNTRGEVIISITAEEAKGLAETILKVIELSRGS
jgi:hypothetical protein